MTDSATPQSLPNPYIRPYLMEVPSETTPAERLLLWQLFKDTWCGQGKVVEIGPFLGGTTRAIALGMLDNPNRAPDSELHTFDRFAGYYDPKALRERIDPLVKSAAFTEEEANALCKTGDFLALFKAIHSPQPYYSLLRVYDSPLPDLPEEVDTSSSLSCLDQERDMGAIFIDGCKSWASTCYGMGFLLPRTRTNGLVIFQDFGWNTCYWITSVVYALRDYLTYECRADSTYVYRLSKPITREEVLQRFAKSPETMGQAFFKDAAAHLYNLSKASGDLRGEVISILHHVAALAVLHRRAEAVSLLKSIDVKRYFAFASLIQGTIESPTYHPGGKQILWSEI